MTKCRPVIIRLTGLFKNHYSELQYQLSCIREIPRRWDEIVLVMKPPSVNSSAVLPSIPGTLHWRHNDHNGVSNQQPHGCLLNRLLRRRSKKASKFRVTGRDRWIPRTKGQLRGKCFHLMTSSCDKCLQAVHARQLGTPSLQFFSTAHLQKSPKNPGFSFKYHQIRD